MTNYKQQIGDGNLPNKYWVFQYDEKAQLINGEVQFPDQKADGGLLGEFATYEDAIKCIDNKTYLPHSVIEDRLVGMIFEQYPIVCSCCGGERWETYDYNQMAKPESAY